MNVDLRLLQCQSKPKISRLVLGVGFRAVQPNLQSEGWGCAGQDAPPTRSIRTVDSIRSVNPTLQLQSLRRGRRSASPTVSAHNHGTARGPSPTYASDQAVAMVDARCAQENGLRSGRAAVGQSGLRPIHHFVGTGVFRG